ncbi:YraN family protein [Amycolatopsis nigrescens]|uniref:YraN family protein n=1 Tax=Amycolatopsis nigrescens TaxID=381445 RepID=UPI000361C8BC|nr:YraN family protein [Amycolatopsis nigrescens]
MVHTMARRPRRAPEKGVAPHLRLGRRGEELAAAYLKAQGFTVLSRNWRCRTGELDLVVTDGAELVVCEVKARSGTGFGDPAEAVTVEKAARIRRITDEWLRAFHIRWCPIRFDVLAVYLPRGGEPWVRHIPGAF